MRGLAPVTFAILLILAQVRVLAAPIQARDFSSEHATIARIAKGLEALKNARETVWPSYDPTVVPIVLFRSGEVGYLFNYPAPFPEGFRPLTGFPGIAVLDNPRGYQRGINIHQAIGDRVGVTVEWSDDPSWQGKEFLVAVHEAFHVHQRTLPMGKLSAQELQPQSSEDMALAELEQFHLAEALGASPQDIRQSLKRFLAVRLERRKTMSSDDWERQAGLEAKEGTAHYVEVVAELLEADPLLRGLSELKLHGGELPARIERLRDLLLAPLDKANFARSRYYLTGAAMGLALDRLLPGWKARIEQGQPLDSLVQEACGFQGEEQPTLFGRMLSSHDVAGAIARIQAQLEIDNTEVELARKRFLANQGAKVKLVLPKGAQPSLTVDEMVQINRVDTLLAGGSVISLEQPGRSIVIGGASLLEYESERGQFLVTFFLPSEEVQNFAVTKSKYRLGNFTLRSKQVHVRSVSASVFRSAEEIVIELD